MYHRGVGGSWRRSDAGGREGGMQLWRVERLEDASASWFVFLSQDIIFMARAVGGRWCVNHRWRRTLAYKALGGHHPRRA
jgi:hypothetical protein